MEMYGSLYKKLQHSLICFFFNWAISLELFISVLSILWSVRKLVSLRKKYKFPISSDNKILILKAYRCIKVSSLLLSLICFQNEEKSPILNRFMVMTSKKIIFCIEFYYEFQTEINLKTLYIPLQTHQHKGYIYRLSSLLRENICYRILTKSSTMLDVMTMTSEKKIFSIKFYHRSQNKGNLKALHLSLKTRVQKGYIYNSSLLQYLALYVFKSCKISS